ncbi:phage tail family protein [Rhodococcus sp. IEGM 1351]|uniref:phage distal tail protein n=1 Tax=Rhodococcus sp. IEGM 1351 TaxID=3047089 RepID=UPI0024B69424|nr:phage tail domain-containing protein [Rhodococcus sp. IEGM 1351]MDI9934681.1 phage tail family protein [Rhodococcus sp. IEGM 1351]
MSAIGIQYGDFDLQTEEVTTTSTDVYSSPRNNVQADKLAESDGAVIVKTAYEPKTFTAEGYLRTDTVEDTQRLMDDFKVALSVPNQAFDIDHAGDTRRYVATAQNVIITNPRGRTRAGFSVEFLCPSGVGSDTYASVLLASKNFSTSTATLGITAGGTYQVEPIITLTVNTVTGGTAKTITVNNDVTRRGLAVTRTWSNGDVLEIDSLNKTIFVNNVPVNFSGQFPVWKPGVGSIGYVDDLTTRDVTVTADYIRRWL